MSLQTDKKCYFWGGGGGDMQDLANTHTHTRNGENKRLKDESQKHTKKHFDYKHIREEEARRSLGGGM